MPSVGSQNTTQPENIIHNNTERIKRFFMAPLPLPKYELKENYLSGF